MASLRFPSPRERPYRVNTLPAPTNLRARVRESPPKGAASSHRKPLDRRSAGFRVLWDAPASGAGGPFSRGHGPKAPAGPGTSH
jgi:hypothetical protein